MSAVAIKERVAKWFSPKRDLRALPFACIFALLTLFGFAIERWDAVTPFWSTPVRTLCFFVGFVGFSVLFWVLLSVTYGFILRVSKLPKRSFALFDCLPLTALLLFLCWLPVLILAFPGSVSYDVMSAHGTVFGGPVPAYSTHHPLLTTFFYANIENYLEQLFNSSEAVAIFILALLQQIFCALSFAFTIKKIPIFGGGRCAQLITFIFFGFNPLFSCFSQWLVKDTIAAAAFCWWFTLLLLALRNFNFFGTCLV